MNRRLEQRLRAEYRGPHEWADAVCWLANPLAAAPSGRQAPRAALEVRRRALYSPSATAEDHAAYAAALAAVERDEGEVRRALAAASAPRSVRIPRWSVTALACATAVVVVGVATASAGRVTTAGHRVGTGRIRVVTSNGDGTQTLVQWVGSRAESGTTRVVPRVDPTIWKDPDPPATLTQPQPTGNWVFAQVHGSARPVSTAAFHPHGESLYIDSTCVGEGSLEVQVSGGVTVYPRCTPFTPIADSNGVGQDSWPQHTVARVVPHGSVVWAITFSSED